MFVKPKNGVMVPDPERGGYLPDAGRDVPRTQYWLSRLRDGDIDRASTPPESVSQKPRNAKES
jgi:hypothetical protein